VSGDSTAVQLIAMLGELDSRRLYLAEGYSSLFTYCTQCLRLSEHAAYGGIGCGYLYSMRSRRRSR
jgi:hypothetical protein